MPFMTNLRLLDEIYHSGYQMIKFVDILDDIDCPNENFHFCHNYKPIARWTWYVKLDWYLLSWNVTGIVLANWSLGQLTLILETKESTPNGFCRSIPTVNKGSMIPNEAPSRVLCIDLLHQCFVIYPYHVPITTYPIAKRTINLASHASSSSS